MSLNKQQAASYLKIFQADLKALELQQTIIQGRVVMARQKVKECEAILNEGKQ